MSNTYNPSCDCLLRSENLCDRYWELREIAFGRMNAEVWDRFHNSPSTPATDPVHTGPEDDDDDDELLPVA